VGRVVTEYGTFLKATDKIDHVELGITNKDAKAMSLATRKLIELSFLALLDSGIDYRGQNVGCFAYVYLFHYSKSSAL
jgi:acyl transferase domain-containing protein